MWWRHGWISYGELYSRARHVAGMLAGIGVRAGDRVGIISRNHIAYFDLLFAAPLLGFIFVPFDPGSSVGELRVLHRGARPKVLFHGRGLSEVARSMDTEALPLETLQEGPEANPSGQLVGTDDPADPHNLYWKLAGKEREEHE